ncbi:ABC transporter ATP-binding protein [Mangrovicoccus ximenensis]|uniref:ABC transporter ATP-binding protein n=1 Tax=Mangrovicoccus ximenensis TaxID=1911570 RepID=UPI000D3DC8CF|nr:sn-glycerol-3-phosphate ABC transporter ATP-binding protein UgpC [Mangrovicoccus ximenensis]
MASIRMDGLTKAYGNLEVIHGIDLDIEEGEFVALVGPSGCGKSTMLRMIAGLESISRGEIAFDGEVVNEMTPSERGISMVFQSYALYPHLTVRKNLSFGLENLRMKRAEIDARVAEAARMLELDAYLDRKPKALSGGQRQRVAIGRAIVRHPKVFLFDEPLSNLDAKLRVQTRGEITRLHRQLGTTMIYVTHDQVEAMTMAGKIVVLNGGKVEQVGRPLDLFERPANLFVAGFIGSPRMNLYDGQIVGTEGGAARVASPETGELTVPLGHAASGRAVKIGLRPSHFAVGAEAEGSPLMLDVDQVESLGHETYLHGRLNGAETTTIVHVQNHLDAAPGDRLPVRPRAGHVHLFDAASGQSLGRA